MTDDHLNNSPEIWKAIPGFEGYYDVSNQGRVRSYWRRVRRGEGHGKGSESVLSPQPQRMLRQKIEKNGYVSVALSKGGQGRTIKVHGLVLLSFVGPCPPGMEACHGDGIRTRNHLDNLSWDTPKKNSKDRDKHGTTAIGERQWKSKLTENKVRKIRELLSQGYSFGVLEEMFSVSRSTIFKIKKREIWKHI